MIPDIPPKKELLTGDVLRRYVFEERTKIPVIAENFLYKKSIVMQSSDAGVGKSVINTNLCHNFSLGMPLFNFFHVPKPVLCYYLPFERGAYEMADRLRDISKIGEPNWANIVIEPKYIGIDLYDSRQFKGFVDNVCSDLDSLQQLGLEIVVMPDPIISMVSGEIKEEKYAKAITRACNIIQLRHDCAFYLSNHTIKNPPTQAKSKGSGKGKMIDPFYGSQVFKAFCTSGIYVIRSGDGIDMLSTKTSHGNTLDKVHLSFDPFTYALFGKVEDADLKNYDRVLATLRSMRAGHLTSFEFVDVLKHPLCSKVSMTSAKEIILGEEPFRSGLKVETGKGKRTLLSFNDKWL